MYVAIMFLPIQFYFFIIEVKRIICNDLRHFALIIGKFTDKFLLSALSGRRLLIESKMLFSSASNVCLMKLVIWCLLFYCKSSHPDGPEPHDVSPKIRNYYDFTYL